MAVVLYWRERLAARQPIAAPSLWLPHVSYKPNPVNPEDGWPRAVAKQFLLQDYQKWFEESYLPPYTASGFYHDFPDQLPKPATDLDFFVTMSPFLHIVGRDQQTRAYNVKEQHQHEGAWITIKVKKNFVRLLEWKEHVAAFELATGIQIDFLQRAWGESNNMETVAKGIKVVLNRMASNRETIDRTMGKS